MNINIIREGQKKKHFFTFEKQNLDPGVICASEAKTFYFV